MKRREEKGRGEERRGEDYIPCAAFQRAALLKLGALGSMGAFKDIWSVSVEAVYTICLCSV